MELPYAICEAGHGTDCYTTMELPSATCSAVAGVCYSPLNASCYNTLLLILGVI